MTFSYGRRGPNSKLLIQGVDAGYVSQITITSQLSSCDIKTHYEVLLFENLTFLSSIKVWKVPDNELLDQQLSNCQKLDSKTSGNLIFNFVILTFSVFFFATSNLF